MIPDQPPNVINDLTTQSKWITPSARLAENLSAENHRARNHRAENRFAHYVNSDFCWNIFTVKMICVLLIQASIKYKRDDRHAIRLRQQMKEKTAPVTVCDSMKNLAWDQLQEARTMLRLKCARKSDNQSKHLVVEIEPATVWDYNREHHIASNPCPTRNLVRNQYRDARTS